MLVIGIELFGDTSDQELGARSLPVGIVAGTVVAPVGPLPPTIGAVRALPSNSPPVTAFAGGRRPWGRAQPAHPAPDV